MMISKLRTKPSLISIFIVVILSLIFNAYATEILTANYAKSEFPVPYYEAQLSFSSEKIKNWYLFLIENNTFDVYIKTQHTDFLFILSTLFLHFSVLLLVSRLYQKTSKGRGVLIVLALLSTIAPLADTLENIVSYYMLANVLTFPNWIAIIYSSFAAIKFLSFTITYIVAFIGLLIGVFQLLHAYKTRTKLA